MPSFFHTLIDRYARHVEPLGETQCPLAKGLHPGSYSKTILQLHFQLDSTKQLQKLFETDLPGLEITEANVICKNVTLKGSTFVGLASGVFFFVRCALTFNNTRVEMTAGIEISPRGVFITVNSVPGNFGHIIAWIEDMTDLDPAALFACFGPGTTFQELDIQGFRIRLSNDITGKEDPILLRVKLNLELASDFGKVEGKRPVFKVFTWWADHEGGGIWHQQVLGELWFCKFLIRHASWSMKAAELLAYDNSPGRLLHSDYKPWCNQSPYKELTTVINLEDLPGRSEPIEEGYPSQIGRVKVVMTKKCVTFETEVIGENNRDRIEYLDSPLLTNGNLGSPTFLWFQFNAAATGIKLADDFGYFVFLLSFLFFCSTMYIPLFPLVCVHLGNLRIMMLSNEYKWI